MILVCVTYTVLVTVFSKRHKRNVRRALAVACSLSFRAKILLMDADGICATNSAMRNICEQFWFEAVATEKLYWEERYTVDGVVEGVPRDDVRQDMDETDECRRGFARILDLIHRRDGVKLEVNKLPKNITMKKAYTSLVGARNWSRTTGAPIARRFPVSKNFGKPSPIL